MLYRLNFKLKYLPLWALLVILTIVSTGFLAESVKPHSCSIFTAAQGDTVLYGDNFDFHEGELMVGFYPATWNKYGSVHFGYRDKNGVSQFSRVVNDQGLTWAVNSVPSKKVNDHPERQYNHLEDNYFYTISKQAATVEEAIALAQDFDFGGSFGGQIHIADATGDAVVVGPGADGEMAFTRKSAGEGYLFSTNFNLSTPEKGPKDFRWETGNSMLEAIGKSQELTSDYGMSILQALSLDHPTTLTLISRVIDLKKGDIHMVYMSQFDEAVVINIEEELSKGQREVEMRTLFSQETAEAGDKAWDKFETRFRILQVMVVTVGVLLVIGIVLLVVRFVRKRRRITTG